MENPIWWQKHEKISKLQGYNCPEFKWGLFYKAKNIHCSDEKYPTGIECWCVDVYAAGHFALYCSDTAEESVEKAIKGTLDELDRCSEYWEKPINQYKQPGSEIIVWEKLHQQLKLIAAE